MTKSGIAQGLNKGHIVTLRLARAKSHNVALCHAMTKSGIAQGLNKGHIVTLRPRKAKQSERKGKLTERSKVVKEVFRECVGFAPYERRMLELLKIGSAATFKRALKFAKKRLGSHKRGKQKRAQMEGVMQAMRAKQKA